VLLKVFIDNCKLQKHNFIFPSFIFLQKKIFENCILAPKSQQLEFTPPPPPLLILET
jgi:hypothetical protein